MLPTTLKSALVIVAAGTISVTTLALPTARAVAASLAASHLRLASFAQIQEVISGTHDGLGTVAADLVCLYLRNLHPAKPGTLGAGSKRKA
ncbi:MAG: hypothetical protein ACJ746_05300 [Bryobacteraceae bacterium]